MNVFLILNDFDIDLMSVCLFVSALLRSLADSDEGMSDFFT